MGSFNFVFILLHLATALLALMFVYILRMKSKKQIHYAFLANIGLTIIWSLGNILAFYTVEAYGEVTMGFVYLWFLGLCFTPVAFLFIGIIFSRTKIQFSWKYVLLFIVPVISFTVLLTNDYHNLFFVEFSLYNAYTVYGPYFILHSLYSYACIVIGIFYLLYFTIKNAGFFSKQSGLIILGSVIPFVVNIMFTLNLVLLPTYATVIAFSSSTICFMLAIIRFKLLNVVPVALQTVVDNISDSFLVINEDQKIIDYNKTFIDNFNAIFTIDRNMSITDIIGTNTSVNFNKHSLARAIKRAQRQNRRYVFEKHLIADNFDKYFTVEITPIFTTGSYLGAIILLKDITQNKKDMQTINEKQAMLMEQERLASLGQLIGGIAHNLKTPIMSISGGLEALKDLIKEYDESIDDRRVTKADHHEIAAEMSEWLNKIKPYCSYMSDIISAVKGQAVQLSDSTTNSFTIGELLKRVDILMKHELSKYHCRLQVDSRVSLDTVIQGEANNLVQIFDNIIANSIDAYGSEQGSIEIAIWEKDDNIEFTIKDDGPGIPEPVQKRLFKEMITTKGKEGTGLGLYMSYATIKGRFGGKMWFETEEGKGTTFHISIPNTNNSDWYREAVQ